MGAEWWSSFFTWVGIVGAVLVVVGAVGAWHFSGKVQQEQKAATERLRTDNQQLQTEITNTKTDLQRKEEHIRALAARARAIQSLEIKITVDVRTSPRDIGPPATDIGLQSVAALFTKANRRFRFITDFTVTDQQVARDTRRVSFVYRPETPGEIIGQPVDSLGAITVLAVNYAEIFQTMRFAVANEPTRLHCAVVVNGIEVPVLEDEGVPPGVLAARQADFDVAAAFAGLPQTYTEKTGLEEVGR